MNAWILARIWPLRFREAATLVPLVVAAHVYEEWPLFPGWARQFASPMYSDREYLATHAVSIGSALAAALLLRSFATPAVVFLLFAFVIGPGLFFNAWFHIGATLLSRTYCPGVVTGLLLYLPTSLLLVVTALRDGVVTAPPLILIAAVAGAFHTLEVGHNVFKRW